MPDYRTNGWTYKIETDAKRPVSWVYSDVKNWGHSFAREISIEKVILEVKEQGETKTIPLTSSSFEAVGGEEFSDLLPYNPGTGLFSINTANFSIYKARGKILGLKTKKDVLLANNVDGKPVEEPLYIFVTFLFAEYGNDPPHEFTGSLLAARFTPTFRFETKNDSVLSVRVDYRFHFDLDSYLQSASFLTKATEKLKKKIRGKENYALVLRDADSFPPSLMGIFRLLKDVVDLYEGVTFFVARLRECGYGGTCRSLTSGLELKLNGARASDRLDISYRDPRPSFVDPSKALDKTTLTLTDKRVASLLATVPLKYDQTVVDDLAAKIFKAVVGATTPVQSLSQFAGQAAVAFGSQPLPGVSSECLSSYIKYSLVLLAGESYLLRKGGAISKQLPALRATMQSDLRDVLKYMNWSDVDEVFVDIASLIQSLLMEPLLPFLGRAITLLKLLKLVNDMQQLVGKMMSIVAFDGGEKPVLYELVGRFVYEGNVTDTWDNLHLWGTEKIPSAPGAFHACHQHFRWSQLNTYPTPEQEKILDVANAMVGAERELSNKAPQLRSLVKRFVENQLSGPLIDPNIPNQTILFALAVNGGDLDEELKQSDEPFEKARATPQPIATVSTLGNTGKDIVYWLSCKAQREGEKVFKGTMLVNGFYFAHDEEKPLSLFRPSNMFGPTEGVDLQKPIRKKPYKLFRGPFY